MDERKHAAIQNPLVYESKGVASTVMKDSAPLPAPGVSTEVCKVTGPQAAFERKLKVDILENNC